MFRLTRNGIVIAENESLDHVKERASSVAKTLLSWNGEGDEWYAFGEETRVRAGRDEYEITPFKRRA